MIAHTSIRHLRPVVLLTSAASILVPNILSGQARVSTPGPGATACASSDKTSVATVSFEKVGRVVTSTALPDQGKSAVFGVRSIEFTRGGRALVADTRQRRVLLFDSTFSTARVIGREGEGPGEYRNPRQAVLLDDASIAVLDIALARVVEFDLTGDFRRIVRLPTRDPRAIRRMPDGGYLIAGLAATGGQDNLLTRANAQGTAVWRAVPPDSILRAINLIVDGVWMVDAGDDQVLVGLTVAPTISRVRLSDGTVNCRAAIDSDFWHQLSTATRPKQPTLKSMQAWMENATMVFAAARTSDGFLVLTTSRGSGDDERREWIVFDASLAPIARVTGVPGYAMANRGRLLVVTSETEDGVTVIQTVSLDLH